jgi:hypothetical protein
MTWAVRAQVSQVTNDRAGQPTGTNLTETTLTVANVKASLGLSANGRATGSGIVWAAMPSSDSGAQRQTSGVLRAFDAETLRQIWTSEQNAARDRAGAVAPSISPVVANGKVYLATLDGTVMVYGLLPAASPDLEARATAVDQPTALDVTTLAVAATPDFAISVTPASRTVVPGTSTTYSVAPTALNGFTGTIGMAVSGAPSGTTAAFSPGSIGVGGTSTLKIATSSFTPSGTSILTLKGTSGTVSHSIAVKLVIGRR